MYEPIRTEQITLGSTETVPTVSSYPKSRLRAAATQRGGVPRQQAAKEWSQRQHTYQLSDGDSRHRHTVRGQVAAESRRCHACRLALFVSVSTGSSNKRSFLPERASKQRTISLRTEHVPWQLNSSPSFTQPQPPTARRARLRRSCVEAALKLCWSCIEGANGNDHHE